MDTKRSLYGLLVLALAVVAIGGLVAMPAAAQSNDEFESNDHSGEAAEIEPGQYDDLRMADDEWADFYAVELEEGEELSAAIEFDHDESDLELVVNGPNRWYEDYSFSNSDGESVGTVADEGGTYHVVVYGFAPGAADYDLSVETDGEESEGDRFENNDDADEAAAIEPGEYANLTIGDDDRDVFAVEADAGDQIVASSQIHSADADLSLHISGDEQTAGASAGTEWRPSGLVANEDGTYYVTVTSNAPEQVFYDLRVGVGPSDRFDPNEQSDAIPTVEPGDHSNLSLTGGPDVDSYSVDVEAGHTLSAHTDPLNDTEVELMVTNAAGEVVAESDKAPYHAAHSLEFTANESGSYTVNAYVANRTAAHYDLDVDVEEPVTGRSPGLIENQTVSADNTQRYEIAPTRGSEQVAVAARTANPEENVDVAVYAPTFIVTDGDTPGPWSALGFVTDQQTGFEVEVSSDSSDSIQYDLYVNNGSDDSFDPNEGRQNAAEIEAGTHEDLSLVGPADTDYYELDLTTGEQVSLSTVPQYGEPVDLWVSGPNDEQVEVSESHPYGSSESVDFTARTNGTYTVQAYNDDVSDHEGSSYDLEVEVAPPENSEPVAIYDQGVYENQTVTSNSSSTYEIGTIDEGSLLSVATRLEDSNSDVSLSLYAPTEIRYDDEGAHWRSIETVADRSGQYELEVTTTDDEPVEYELQVATGEPDRFDPNDHPSDAPELEAGSYDDLSLTGEAEHDSYAVDLETGERLQVDFESSDDWNTTLTAQSAETDQYAFESYDDGSKSLTLTANTTGTYHVNVDSHASQRIDYGLDVNVSEA